MLEKDIRNRILLAPDNGGVSVGPNSIWAKFQASTASASTPDSPIRRGQFPDTGTSLLMPGAPTRPEGKTQAIKWYTVETQLAVKHASYLEQIRKLELTSEPPHYLPSDLEQIPREVVRSLIRRGRLPLQPEHLDLFIDQIIEGLPSHYQETAHQDPGKRFCNHRELQQSIRQRVQALGFIPLQQLEPKEKQKAIRGLKTHKLNGALYTTPKARDEYRKKSKGISPELLAKGFTPLEVSSSTYSVIRHRFDRFLLHDEGRLYITPTVLSDILDVVGTTPPIVESETTPGFVSVASIAGESRPDYKRLVRAAQAGKIRSVTESPEGKRGNIPLLFIDPGEATAYLESHPGYKKPPFQTDPALEHI